MYTEWKKYSKVASIHTRKSAADETKNETNFKISHFELKLEKNTNIYKGNFCLNQKLLKTYGLTVAEHRNRYSAI